MRKSQISIILSLKPDTHCWEVDVNGEKIKKNFPEF